MTRSKTIRVVLLALLPLLLSALGAAQTQASGTLNATLVNLNGIAIVFNTDASGVTLTGSGSATAAVNFGNVSAYGALAAGVTRSAVSASSFTVSTPFDVDVVGGLLSNSYTLTVSLGSAAPTGLSYILDSLTLTTAAQNVTTAGTYNTSAKHTLGLKVSTLAPSSGGPATGTAITTTLNFVASAN